MKAKKLIELLETIPPEADVVTPGFDETGATEKFTLTPCFIKWDYSSSFGPHDYSVDEDIEDNYEYNGYVLDGDLK